MVAGGACLFFRATTPWALRILLRYLVLWQMLKFPALVVAPKVEGVYLGFGELAVLLAGGWTLFAVLGDFSTPRWLGWIKGDRGVRTARYYFAVWIIPIGLSHWIYLKPSVDLVPPWLPYKAFWACLAGAGQIASGLGVLLGVLPRIAAWAEAIQISLYAAKVRFDVLVTNDVGAIWGFLLVGPRIHVDSERRTGAEAHSLSGLSSARLQSCPDTKLLQR